MKYIVLAKELHEVPIIFPEFMVHLHVSVMLMHSPELEGYQPIAAGFVRLPATMLGKSFDISCYGESETLKMRSRGKIDEDLITWYQYTAGMKDALIPGMLG